MQSKQKEFRDEGDPHYFCSSALRICYHIPFELNALSLQKHNVMIFQQIVPAPISLFLERFLVPVFEAFLQSAHLHRYPYPLIQPAFPRFHLTIAISLTAPHGLLA
ncbi:hypothetical protein HZA42_05110 [Candidatus Peregrinibacteria bacterium]|nr:hypothetical protein [Candidatus Peregrinibacteria bacterium]